MSYKNINLTVPEVESLIKDWLKSVNGSVKIIPKSNNLFQFVITIPGQDQALINIYQTKKGLTLDPTVGSNPQLSEKITKFIISQAEKVEPFSQTLKGIHEDLFEEFLDALQELEIDLVEQKEKDNLKQIKLRNTYNHLITLNYYPSTATLLIQGHSTKLFKDVVFWFLDKTIESPEEIVKIIFQSIQDFEKYQIKFPDEIIDKALENEIGIHYKDDKFLKDTERKWLKVSYYLLKFEKDLPDYYPSISASLKVIEGILRRIIINHCGLSSSIFNPKSKSILIFDFNQSEQKWELKRSFYSSFNNDNQKIAFIENLYNFLKVVRNRLFHNFGIPEHSALPFFQEAEEIFKEIIELLKTFKKVFPKGV